MHRVSERVAYRTTPAIGFVLVGIPIYYMTQRNESTDSPLIVCKCLVPEINVAEVLDTDHKIFAFSSFWADAARTGSDTMQR